ncbi:NUDIX hydrolase [Amycolatopsis sp. NBC_01307]|uniref:NUDIX hydrolase n=1 Tax=Amycolatopsis sp. NBC_01307 TaxID=2903561 RepID=UPI002E0EDCE9|nr:NUDIX hydrolase [Amycolatopsis sp. NBC_01307]
MGAARRRPGPGEKLEDTARREIAEETGLVLDEIGRKFWTRRSHSGTPPTSAPASSNAAGGRLPPSQSATTNSCRPSCRTSCKPCSTAASRRLRWPSPPEIRGTGVDARLRCGASRCEHGTTGPPVRRAAAPSTCISGYGQPRPQ